MSLGKRLADRVICLYKRAAVAPVAASWWGRSVQPDIDDKAAALNKNIKSRVAQIKQQPRQPMQTQSPPVEGKLAGKSAGQRAKYRDSIIRGNERFRRNFAQQLSGWKDEQAELVARANELGLKVDPFSFKYDPSTASKVSNGDADNQRMLNNMHKRRSYREAYEKYNNDLRNRIQQKDTDNFTTRYIGEDTTSKFKQPQNDQTTTYKTPEQWTDDLLNRGNKMIVDATRAMSQPQQPQPQKNYSILGYQIQEAQNKANAKPSAPVGPRVTQPTTNQPAAANTNTSTQSVNGQANPSKPTTHTGANVSKPAPQQPSQPAQQQQTKQPAQTQQAPATTTPTENAAVNKPTGNQQQVTAPGKASAPNAANSAKIDLGNNQTVTKVKTNNGYRITFPDGRVTTYTTDPGNDPQFYQRAIDKNRDWQAIKTQTKQFGQDARKHLSAYNNLTEEYNRLPVRLADGSANPARQHLANQLAEAKKFMQNTYGQYMNDPNNPYGHDIMKSFNSDFTYNDNNRRYNRVNWLNKPKHLTNAEDIANWEDEQIKQMQMDSQIALMKANRQQRLRDDFMKKWNPQPQPQPQPQQAPAPKLYSQMTPHDHQLAGQKRAEDALNALGLNSKLPMSYTDVYKGY